MMGTCYAFKKSCRTCLMLVILVFLNNFVLSNAVWAAVLALLLLF